MRSGGWSNIPTFMGPGLRSSSKPMTWSPTGLKPTLPNADSIGMEQEQVRKNPPKEKDLPEKPVATKRSEEDEELIRHSDELLDEIDGILEENAEAFVANYVQGGGQ